MIGYLRGQIIDKEEKTIIIDTGGVGYRVQVVGDAADLSGEVELFIYTYVRDDDISLFGFEDKKAIEIFKLLISVSGIGPKVASSVLDGVSSDKIIKAVGKADVSFFTAIPGIGKKSAQKIIIDLKEKIGSVTELDLGEDSDDIVDGLVSMGYAKYDVQKAIREIDPDLSEEKKIKEVIKMLKK